MALYSQAGVIASDPLVLLTQTFIITVILLLFLSDFLKYNTHI